MKAVEDCFAGQALALEDAPAVPDTRLLRSFRSTVEQDRRQAENLKIACGRKHFELSKDMVFRDVTELEGLVA